MTETMIESEIDFSITGKQMGYLRLPHSVHRSAYGWIPIPIACIANGSGPTAVLMAGNHGDEYEGQVALSKLIRELEPQDVQGRVIVLPMANFPAAVAGRRTSPIDEGNLNRLFVGEARGTVTQVIAHYIEEVLFAEADLILDLHSGGSSLIYLPTSLVPRPPGQAPSEAQRGIAEAFGLPYALFYEQFSTGDRADHAARRKNALYLSTELGGAGTVTPEILRLAEQGSLKALKHVGIYQGSLDAAEEPATLRSLDSGAGDLVYAMDAGLFEPLVGLGDEVRAGALAGLIHHPETPGRAATPVNFACDGLVLCKRVPARVERGDCLYHLGVEPSWR